MSDEKQFRKEAFIGEIVEAGDDFADSDYVRLPTGGDDDLVLSRATYPELSTLLPNLNKQATVKTNITNPTTIANDLFGGGNSIEFYTGNMNAVSGDGTRLIIGAPGEDSAGSAAGRAWIYRWDSGSEIWVYEADIIHPDGLASGFFGWSVDIDDTGTRIVIGAATRLGANFFAGAAYIYSRSGTTWSLEQRIDNPLAQTNGYFSQTVHFDENADRVAIGGVKNNNGGVNGNGHVYVYSRSGTVWTQETDIVTTDNYTNGLLGKWLIMNKQGNVMYFSNGDGQNQCLIHCYHRNGTTWTEKYKIWQPINATSDLDGINAHNYGKLAMSESPSGNGKDEQYLVITEYITEFPHNTSPESGRGVVHIYDISNGTNDVQWIDHHAKLVYVMAPPEEHDNPAGDYRLFFGSDAKISADGKYLMVGANYFNQTAADNAGRVYLFENNGFRWDLIQTLDGWGGVNYSFGSHIHASRDFSKLSCGMYGATGVGGVQMLNFEPDTTNMTFRPTEGKNKFMRVK